MNDLSLSLLAKTLATKLKQKQLMLACAESCTGGQVSYVCTSLAGSSDWFERGFVTYSNEAKQEMLGVPVDIISQYGAVSEQTAIAMAKGAIRYSHAEISVAITGIAGPSGGTRNKPVGLVWIAWAQVTKQVSTKVKAQHFNFIGSRIDVRNQAVQQSLIGLINFLS